MSLLSEIILRKINHSGPISFHDFMETVLYYPEVGYYTSKNEKIGTNGDYNTSTYYTKIFGELLARQFEEMWMILGKKPFTIVEYGAGTGTLCRDILEYLSKNSKLYDELRYCIIERSPSMQKIEKEILKDKVYWYDSILEIPDINGCVFSNELVDNFAVHQVVMADGLMEIFVDRNDNNFVELIEPASHGLKEYFRELNVLLTKGYRTEINLQVIDWLREISIALKKGFLLTIDYGYPSSELYNEQRRFGTLLCYKKHKINYSPYDYLGEQDITAHVNFSAINNWGLKNGLEFCGYTNQYHFLHALGLIDHLKRTEEHGKYTLENLHSIYKLLVSMGIKFKILVQAKGVNNPGLSGLKFAEHLS